MIVLNDEGCETTASSHDLLASAVGNMVVLQSIPEVARSSLYTDQHDKKLKILMGLYEANETLVTGTNEEQLAQDAYDMFQHAFRQFMLCYPGSNDLRFAPIDTVDPECLVHKQAIKHLTAQAKMTGETLHIAPKTSYAQILNLYSHRMRGDS